MEIRKSDQCWIGSNPKDFLIEGAWGWPTTNAIPIPHRFFPVTSAIREDVRDDERPKERLTSQRRFPRWGKREINYRPRVEQLEERIVLAYTAWQSRKKFEKPMEIPNFSCRMRVAVGVEGMHLAAKGLVSPRRIRRQSEGRPAAILADKWIHVGSFTD